MTHALTLLSLHVHDLSVSALAAAVVTLGVVILLELRSVMRLRHVVDNQLGRIFEQLDLLRFETQQLLEGQQAVETRRAPEAAVVIGNAAEVAASVPSPSAIASRSATPAVLATGVPTAGEARLLSSLAQARARRLEAASA